MKISVDLHAQVIILSCPGYVYKQMLSKCSTWQKLRYEVPVKSEYADNIFASFFMVRTSLDRLYIITIDFSNLYNIEV